MLQPAFVCHISFALLPPSRLRRKILAPPLDKFTCYKNIGTLLPMKMFKVEDRILCIPVVEHSYCNSLLPPKEKCSLFFSFLDDGFTLCV